MTIRDQLISRLDHLERQDLRIEAHMRAPLEGDSAEQALQVEADEVVAGLHDRTRQEMNDIRSAISRLDQGTYGACDACGEPIPAARLALVPWATRCIECTAAASP